MQKLVILNTREKKKVIDELKEIYGFSGKIDGALFFSSKQKYFLLSGGFDVLEQGLDKELFIDKMGVYIGAQTPEGIRLSVEGSQLIGLSAEKNVLVISDDQLEAWVRGESFEIPGFKQEGLFIIKYKNDFLGCARIKKGVVHNMVSKNRWVKTLNR